MNCKDARLLIAGLNGDSLPEGLADHAADCPACAELLDLDFRLRATLRRHAHAPSPYVLGRIRQEIAAPAPVRLSRFEDLVGNRLMKIALPATALIAVALAVLPRLASAADPHETFAKMTTAVYGRAKKLDPKEESRVRDRAVWAVVKDELTELRSNSVYGVETKGETYQIVIEDPKGTKARKGGKTILKDARIRMVKVGDAARISRKDPKTGKPHVDYLWSYPSKAYVTVSDTIHLSLDETKYQRIAYGATQDQLVLTPLEKGPRYVVLLDGQTRLPKQVRVERPNKGLWILQRSANVRYL